MTGMAGLEPSTYRLGGGRSILLSYIPSCWALYHLGQGVP
jgi:hypothetical protein